MKTKRHKGVFESETHQRFRPTLISNTNLFAQQAKFSIKNAFNESLFCIFQKINKFEANFWTSNPPHRPLCMPNQTKNVRISNYFVQKYKNCLLFMKKYQKKC